MILTTEQHHLLKEHAADVSTWRDEADLERRRRIANQMQSEIKRSGILEGGTLDHKTLCELVSLQWQVQNLNPKPLPQLLGLYHYQVHFRGFEGIPEDLQATREVKSGAVGMHEGADMTIVSESLRLIASDNSEDHYRGVAKFFDVLGAGVALVSGFLHLLHPEQYGLINKASISPFVKDGWLNVNVEQRKEVKKQACERFPIAQKKDQVLGQIFRWQMFLEEVLRICDFEDYHEVDQLIWTLEGGNRTDPRDLLKPILDKLPAEKENIRVRAEAEAKARKLIDSNLGSLTADQLTQLFELLNTNVGKKGVVYTRFTPAFVGHNANLLIERVTDLNLWISKLWQAGEDELPNLLDQFWEQSITGGGRSLPTAILYLRDKDHYAVWTSKLERALYSVVSGMPAKNSTGFSYIQYNYRLRRLRNLTGFPPELHDWILFKVNRSNAKPTKGINEENSGSFSGFTADTFKFMSELVSNNNQTWFQANQPRFSSEVDKPLRALVKDLGEEVITSLDPGLETSPKSGKCISRIRKNVWGKKEEDVYHNLYWAAFYRKKLTKQTDCQFFLSIRPDKFQYGIFFGEEADAVRKDLVHAMEMHRNLAERIFERLKRVNLFFAPGDNSSDDPEPEPIENYDDFFALAKEHRFHVFRRLTPEAAVAKGSDLKNTTAHDFLTLYPLFLLAVSPNPQKDIPPYLQKEDDGDGEEGDDVVTTIADLAAATYMEEQFFTKLDLYLKDKQQLIFYGPPGTGKTFVALEYARYLTQNKGETHTVQFHPSYAYEDFMEGLRPVTREGQLTYEVQDGIFKEICDKARANPDAKYVLLVDEINRGNLPRIFGELLFLLERREETTLLPYSKKQFSIPRNVILLGTMNSADRSIALMDLALRRRFHFVSMEPRVEVLLAWLKDKKKPLWIKNLFEQLNETLRSENIDEDHLIGHAHFMSSHLDDEYLELIWEGTIEPMLREYFFTEPAKLDKFQLEKFQLKDIEDMESNDELETDSEDEGEESSEES
ncbi:MAG: hypothetical protein COA78_35440 [Blastopirellula sp.]|nr:MAG: hypothetical protein COA78_35440 [Blastopirellula sp.]